MVTETRRLFINNLENNVTEEELRDTFCSYGTVTSVEVKERKNPVGNQTQQFAYINISTKDHTLHKCIEELTSKKWKGHFLNIQIAKESFIDRLKREREQTDVTDILSGTKNVKPININIKRYKKPHLLNLSNDLDVKHVEIDSTNSNRDNEKRLKSLVNMKKGYRQQKLIIKNSLLNIDKANSTNKIRFDNNDNNKIKKFNRNKDHMKGQEKMQLFDDNGDEDLFFEVQDLYNSAKGQKLMNLQSRFRNDDRFKMDSRFLEEDQDEEEFPENGKASHENETEKQLQILESIIGKNFSRPSSSNRITDKKKTNMMFRFDPSQPRHSKFEMQQEIGKENLPTKKHKNEVVSLVEEQHQQQPEVSKETFYKVTSDFKLALHENEYFSLSKLFSNQIEPDLQKVETEELISKPKILYKTNHDDGHKVFKYDSTDEEDDDKNNEPDLQLISSEPNEVKNHKLQIKPRMWTETFFFKNDDYRLQEGYDFIMRMQLGEQENFEVVRRNLKQITRAKVKNNLRKNRLFKRKLGGNMKRLKVKRALNR
ncbi:hypothetical protein FQR65_LT03083 [Abscondita terminalis]|nr:hypothetical protein FQR65_LT03083 [Abscondita terminalis]